MLLTDTQIQRLADAVLRALCDKAEMTLKVERGQVLSRIVEIIAADRAVEAQLDREAQTLLKAHMGAAGGDVDQRKLFVMIKKKLADEKGYPL